ncbi:MAG: coniferyl aldehyde dehydrogenase [Paracoccus denitrificans]|nr:MAG: coniferyl aldehyde dehydrogenase [Paracoccus denitrificans]PZO82849.1 MAG: coniferyl aldehyde dehydrogenase [Paracoccus denitrificans]
MHELGELLDAQRRAFRRDGVPTVDQRKAALRTLRGAVLLHRDDLSRAVSQDFTHRSAHETEILELIVVIQSIDYLLKNLQRFMRPERRHVAATYRPGKAWVEYQPKGVIGIMSPWNYPISLTLVPLATALAAGNRAMVKTSELTPKTSALLREILAAAFPTEQVAVVLGDAEVGAVFSALPFDHLLFTGSTAVGRKVMRAASGNLVPVTLELGGKSPAIIAPGELSQRTIDAMVFGKLANAGQTCIAPDYALVHRADIPAFVDAFDAAVRRFYPAGPTSPDYSAIVNEKHTQRLTALLSDASAAGATVRPVGVRSESAAQRRQTIAPTVVLDALDTSALMQDEIFGPILPIRPYDTLDEAIDFIDARPRPLALYYFGPETEGRRVLARTTSGNVCLNATLLHFAQDDLPFGGIGPSGMGAYHGIEGFRSLSHAKGIYAPGRWNIATRMHAPFRRLAALAAWMNLR